MKTRQEVLKQIGELNEKEAFPRKMMLVLRGETIVEGEDVGLNGLIVSTRFVLKKRTQENEMELVKMIASGEKPDFNKYEDKDADEIVKNLEEIEGVNKVMLSKYEAHVLKASLFDWDEVVGKVLGVLEMVPLEKEFKLKGLSGVVN